MYFTTLLLATYVVARSAPDWRQKSLTVLMLPEEDPVVKPAEKVNVTLYAMSRCPDARMCESVFEEVLKRDGITDKINLTIDYIADIDNNAAYGADCMHGDIECAGNAHQLCLAHYLYLRPFYASLACMNYGDFPGNIGSVAFTRKCAEQNGIDWWKSGVGRCIEGRNAERQGRAAQRFIKAKGKGKEKYPEYFDVDEEESPEYLGRQGRRLLRESIQRTKEAGVTKSCTIDITSTIKHEGKRRCIVDGGVWKGCDDGHTPADFVRVIEKEWKNLQDRD